MKHQIWVMIIAIFSCLQNATAQTKSDNMLFQKIPTSEYDPAILYYSDKAVQGETVAEVLKNSLRKLEDDLAKIPADKINFRYGFGKWSVGEVLQHIISYERIMNERALITAGLVQSDFKYQYYTQSSTAAGGNNKTKTELIEEFLEVRKTTIATFARFDEQQLRMMGKLDGFNISVRMLSLCISGHQVHHFSVLRDRYEVL